MADLLQQGSDWLQAMRHEHLTGPVTYRRGADETTLNATIGQAEYESSDEYGIAVKTVAMDFLVRVEDLRLAGLAVVPLPGDQIRLARDGKTLVFEVMSLPGQGHWRWSDPYRITMRIHTKEVGTA